MCWLSCRLCNSMRVRMIITRHEHIASPKSVSNLLQKYPCVVISLGSRLFSAQAIMYCPSVACRFLKGVQAMALQDFQLELDQDGSPSFELEDGPGESAGFLLEDEPLVELSNKKGKWSQRSGHAHPMLPPQQRTRTQLLRSLQTMWSASYMMHLSRAKSLWNFFVELPQ